MIRSSLLRRLLVLPAALGLASAGLVVATTPAQAAPIGSLTFTSSVNDGIFNNQDDTFSFQTDGACPTSPTNSTNFLIRVSGPGLPAAPDTLANIQGNSAGSTIGGITNGPFSGPVQFTLSNFAANQAQPGGYLGAGTYTLELVCRTAFQAASLGEFVGQLTVTGSGASSVVAGVAPAADTSTALTTSPVDTAAEGQTVTLTATVSNLDAPATTPTGSVLFKDDGVAIGSAVAVNASGVATKTVSTLAVGANVITAEFTGGSGFADSVSAGTTLTITPSTSVPVLVAPPTLTGAIKVGGTAVCTTGTWTGASSYLYEFLRNGAVVQSSATDKDLVLAAGDLGTALACRVTATNGAGSAQPSATAAKTVGAGSAATATVKPKIVGKAKVGKTVKANRGTWAPAASYSYNYVWKRGAKVVKQGATATSYKLTKKDKKKKITLTVQAKRTGYATGSATSAAVKVK